MSLGCKSNPAKLEECLQQADPGKITSMQNEAVMQPAHLGLIFVPTVDGVFLTDTVEVDLQLCSCCSNILHFATFKHTFFLSPSFENFLHHKHQTMFCSLLQELLRAGNLPKKELLLGLNQDEGTYFLMYGAPGLSLTGDSLITRKDFLAGVGIQMTYANEITKESAIFQYTDWTDEYSGKGNRDSLGALVGDQDFVCPLLEFANR